jgi:E3 ubiquitin-protein ligase UBR4
MFRELHSEKEEEKANFILSCIKLIEGGDCDTQEMRFLFEEICKVIDPVKPEPDYLLVFSRPRTQEEFFGGRMSKNHYLSSTIGKTMGEVRVKICKETNTAEPELVELLVDNKIVGMDLTVRQVYEQVYWPALCRRKNPDAYEIPSIEDAPKNQLEPMMIVYRLMGIDGEATEDRVESLQDGSEADMDPANIQKKFGFTQILSTPFA